MSDPEKVARTEYGLDSAAVGQKVVALAVLLAVESVVH